MSGTAGDMANRVQSINPFKARDEYPRGSVITHRVCSVLSYLLVVITSIYYTFECPHEGNRSRHTIWEQNRHHHSTFALNSAIITIYWIVLYTLQIPYLASFYPSANNPPENVKHACDLAPHFVTHNLLTFGFIHLWCRSYFWEGLLLLVINFIQLTIAHLRFPNKPRNMHIAVVAGPLAFSFVALFWDGAAAVHSKHPAAHVAANVFVWTWAVWGLFYLIVFKDWAIGFALAALTAALGVSQFLIVIVALQWIFAFTVMGLLFVLSVAVAAPGVLGWELMRGTIVSEDREREPLLREAAA